MSGICSRPSNKLYRNDEEHTTSKWVSHAINDVIDDWSLSLYNVAINYSQLMWLMNTILHSLYYCDTHYNMPVEGIILCVGRKVGDLFVIIDLLSK